MPGQSGTSSGTDGSPADGKRFDALSWGLGSSSLAPAKASGTPDRQRKVSLAYCRSVVYYTAYIAFLFFVFFFSSSVHAGDQRVYFDL